MDSIVAIARRHDLAIVEDAAQGVMAGYKSRALGAIGDLGSFSFHETKNIISGEGGSLLVRDAELVQRAEIIREKGTDRGRFFRGEVDKYTWQDVGSSFLPSEIIAAFLWAQLEEAERITRERMAIWQRYHAMLAPLEQHGLLRRPIIPADCQHNGHMYYVLLAPEIDRQTVLRRTQGQRHPRGVSLCPAAFLARRHALRTRARRSFVDDVAVGTSDQAADVARPDRSPAAAHIRGIECHPQGWCAAPDAKHSAGRQACGVIGPLAKPGSEIRALQHFRRAAGYLDCAGRQSANTPLRARTAYTARPTTTRLPPAGH